MHVVFSLFFCFSSFQWSSVMTDLLHHTEEWRANAARARRRENKEANGESIAMQGFDNIALQDDEKVAKE